MLNFWISFKSVLDKGNEICDGMYRTCTNMNWRGGADYSEHFDELNRLQAL